MKSYKMLIQLTIVLSTISCGQVQKKRDLKSLDNLNTVNNDFELFSSQFRLLEIEYFSNLDDIFTNKYLANEDSLILIDKRFKEKFLLDIDTSYVYYGFKTLLQNNAVILTVLNHQKESFLNDDGELIDNYEYSTGKSYASCNFIPEDTLCIADLTLTKLYLDYNTNTVKVINKFKKKAKVRESYSSPTYLEEVY